MRSAFLRFLGKNTMRFTEYKTRAMIDFLAVTTGILILSLAFFSCGGTKDLTREESTLAAHEWEDKTPAEILSELKEQQAGIHDLTAHFSLSLHPPPKKGFSNLQGIFFFARGEKGRPLVRIKALGPFGTVLFDMVRKGGKMEVFIPSKETLYRGNPGGTSTPRNRWGNSLMEMMTDFSDLSVPDNGDLAFTESRVVLPLTRGEIRLDRRKGLVREWRKPGKTISYGNFHKEPGGPPVPTRIEIRDSDNSHHARCTLSRICLNCRPGDVFDLSRYKPRFIRDLSDLSG